MPNKDKTSSLSSIKEISKFLMKEEVSFTCSMAKQRTFYHLNFYFMNKINFKS